MTEQDRTGKRVRLILVGDRFYSGKVISEDVNTITIIDKFNKEVTLGKASIISLEVLE